MIALGCAATNGTSIRDKKNKEKSRFILDKLMVDENDDLIRAFITTFLVLLSAFGRRI
tara:strand:- start:1667 stop:1840 length:174 start_codon:yes stop_codon:yes gene_type:complete